MCGTRPWKTNKSKGKGKTKGKSKGKKGGSNKREAKGKKGEIHRSHMANVQIAMNMVAGVEIAQIWPTKWQEPIPPSTLASSAIQPAATASSSTVARRIFQLGSAPSNPSLPIFLVTSHLRMVLVHDLEHEWTTVAQGPGEEEWVIVDCGSDVSHLPARFQAASGSDFALAALQNCHSKKLNWLLQLWMANRFVTARVHCWQCHFMLGLVGSAVSRWLACPQGGLQW